MSKWKYRKPEATDIRGLCILCNKNLQKKTSRGLFQALCGSCEIKRFKMEWPTKSYRKLKNSVCERCHFTPENKCQLDVHHKDGNHSNNNPENLETLCANCHRLEHIK